MAKAKTPPDPLGNALKAAFDAAPDAKPLHGKGGLFKTEADAGAAVEAGFFDRTEVTGPPAGRGKAKKPPVPLGILTQKGVRRLLDGREQKAHLAALLPVLERMAGPPPAADPAALRAALDAAATKCVAAVELAFAGMKDEVLAALRPAAPRADPAPVLAALRGALERVEAVSVTINAPVSSLPPSPPPATPAPAAGPDPAALADEAVGFVEAVARDRTVGPDFAELYDHLRGRHPALTIGAFHDALRALDRAGRVRLKDWPRMLDEMPRPELALFLSHRVMYHAQPAR